LPFGRRISRVPDSRPRPRLPARANSVLDFAVCSLADLRLVWITSSFFFGHWEARRFGVRRRSAWTVVLRIGLSAQSSVVNLGFLVASELLKLPRSDFRAARLLGCRSSWVGRGVTNPPEPAGRLRNRIPRPREFGGGNRRRARESGAVIRSRRPGLESSPAILFFFSPSCFSPIRSEVLLRTHQPPCGVARTDWKVLVC
jgi:hypothetical protein